MSKWTQLYIKTDRTPQQLQRVEPLLMLFKATFVAPKGLPLQTKEDMYEVRVFDVAALPLVEKILAAEGLTIAMRTEN
jgi:hypothetical protein